MFTATQRRLTILLGFAIMLAASSAAIAETRTAALSRHGVASSFQKQDTSVTFIRKNINDLTATSTVAFAGDPKLLRELLEQVDRETRPDPSAPFCYNLLSGGEFTVN